MLRTTIETIRKACSIGSVPRVCNDPALCAVIRKTLHKSTNSTEDGLGLSEKATDFPILKTTSPDTTIPLTHREKCQKIIKQAFGTSQPGPVKEQYCSHTVNIEATRSAIEEAEKERKKLQKLDLKEENPMIADDRQHIFKMNLKLIKADDDVEKIKDYDGYLKMQVANAPLREPKLDYAEENSDNLLYCTVENPYNKRVHNVTTAKEQDEELAQKLETIEETPLVEAQKHGIEGFNVNPKVLGDQLNPTLTCKSLHKKQSNPEEGNLPGTYDEVAKRCLNHPLGQIDEILVKEMETMGLPLNFNPENKTPSTLIRDEQLVQIDLCNETNQQEHQEIYPKSTELKDKDEEKANMFMTSPRGHIFFQVRLPDLNEQAEEITLIKSKDIEPGKKEDSVPEHPNPDLIKTKLKPVSCDNNSTAKFSCPHTTEVIKPAINHPTNLSSYHPVGVGTGNIEANEITHCETNNASDLAENDQLLLLEKELAKDVSDQDMKPSATKVRIDSESYKLEYHSRTPEIQPKMMNYQAVLDERDAANILVERVQFTKHFLPGYLENSPNEDKVIEPCSNKLHSDVHSENLKPKKVTLPEELMKEHELDPYYVLTCNETCPISPGPSWSDCTNTDFVDTTDTIYMKKNICESVLPKQRPNNLVVPIEKVIDAKNEGVKTLMSQYDTLTSDTKAQINDKINLSESVQAKVAGTHLVTPQPAHTQRQIHKIGEVDFKLIPENTPKIIDLPNITPKVSPEGPSLPSSQPITLTELLRRVRQKSRIQCISNLGVKVDPTTGTCKKSPRCQPTGPRSPPSEPVPLPTFGLPMVKRRPKVCPPKKKGSKKCAACDIDVTCGGKLGGIYPEIDCELDEGEARRAVSRVDLTEVIFDHIQTLGNTVAVVLRQLKSNVETLLAREYDPWAPIPSWPFSKNAGNPCDKHCGNWTPAPPCVRGCPVFPKARAMNPDEPPSDLKPCKGFPKRRSFSALDCFAVSLENDEVYDLGQFEPRTTL